MTTTRTLVEFNQLKDAEDYFAFFGLDYDPQVLNINRLHILRKFSLLVQSVNKSQSEEQVLNTYRQYLKISYSLFLTSNSVEQKLFKVFQDKPRNVVMLSDIGVE